MESSPQSPHRGSLLAVFLTVFIDLIGFGMVLPLLPIYAKQFAVDEGGLTIGLLMSSFSAMQFLFAPVWGRLSDRVGRRPVLMIGLAGSVVFYMLFAVATVQRSLLLLFVSRIGAGIAGATIPTAQAYIADSTSLEHRARGMALVGAAFGLGFTFGPLLAYFALPSEEGVPGPGPGYAASAMSAIALALAWFKLPESLRPDSAAATSHWLDWHGLRAALRTPSIAALLLTSFVCVFSFANFESTLALLVKDENGAFAFDFHGVCLTFAYIGLLLTVIQGGVVRRLSGRIDERAMATFGSITEIVGLMLLVWAMQQGSLTWLLVSLATVVAGFAFITPSIHSLISRRSDPARQGAILGVTQSASALARIVGPIVGVTFYYQRASAPIWTATGLMAVGLAVLLMAVRGGADWTDGA